MGNDNSRIKVGITMGDPSGIGPEVIARSLAFVQDAAEIVIIGDAWVFSLCPEICVPASLRLKWVDLKNVVKKDFSFGKIKAAYGRASVEYLNEAMELMKKARIDCLVTAPICKESIARAGFDYSGHTEYFIRHTHASNAVMMLLNDKLRFSLVTRHIPLKAVPSELTRKAIRTVISSTYTALKDLFAVEEPRLVVCGLNPHASDHGVIGDEENRVIKPAVKSFSAGNIPVDGPYPADIAIAKAFHGEYDGVIALYHDQALIPLKLCRDFSGVNITLGLPFVRTSPLHGTAFDIAGKMIANPGSMIEAIKYAIVCASNRKRD